jgi:hypothetical protein
VDGRHRRDKPLVVVALSHRIRAPSLELESVRDKRILGLKGCDFGLDVEQLLERKLAISIEPLDDRFQAEHFHSEHICLECGGRLTVSHRDKRRC